MIKSHIQISKGQLKGFVIKGKKDKVYLYDLKHDKIVEKSIKDINFEQGYYSPQIEQVLGEQLEVDFGGFRDNINKNIRNKTGYDELSWGKKDTIKMINFIKYSYLRSESTVRLFKKIYPDCARIKNMQDVLIYMGTQTHELPIEKELFEYNTLIIYNSTDLNLIVSKSCFYKINIKELNNQKFNYEWFVIPIGPKCAIVMIHNNDCANFKDYSFRHQIKEKRIIDELNMACLNAEIENGFNFLVSNSYKTLEQMKDYCYKNQQFISSEILRYEIENEMNKPLKDEFVSKIIGELIKLPYNQQ